MTSQWRSTLFASGEGGQRRRRGTDGLRVVVALLTVMCCVAAIRYSSHVDRVIVQFVHPPPSGVSWLVTLVYFLGVYGLTGLLIAMALVSRRWGAVKDVVLSAGAAALISALFIVVLGSQAGRQANSSLAGFDRSFPLLQIAIFTAVVTAALSYLSRTMQRIIEASLLLAALAAVVSAHGLPLNVIGSIAIGWGSTAAVHLLLGSPNGLASSDEVRSLLDTLGIAASGLRPLADQVWGVARFEADEMPVGYRLAISVYGRDALDARLLSKVGRFLFYRDSGPTLSLTRLQEVEREAFLTLWAARAGVGAPEILAAGCTGERGDALLVCRLPLGQPLASFEQSPVSDKLADAFLAQMLTLRAANFAHGALNGHSVYFDPTTNEVALTDFRNATLSASVEQLDRDLASAIAVVALLIGADRTTAVVLRCLDTDILPGVLAHLRRAGLDPVLARQLRSKTSLLENVRSEVAKAATIELPELVEPRRISWSTLILVVGSLIGGWALIATLLDVSRSFDTIIGASWGWVVGAFFLSHAAFLPEAVEDLGGAPGALPLGRMIALEVSNTFISLAGGSVAEFGTRVRFFQQQGFDASAALSSGTVVTAANWVTKGVMLLISLPLAWGTLHAVAPESANNMRLVWVLLCAVLGVGVLSGAVVLIPRLRRFALEQVRSRAARVWHEIRQVLSVPSNVVKLFGGSLCAELLVVLTLASALRAFGDHLSLSTLILVISLAAMLGGVSPVPGGLGVIEAGLIVGITSAGVSEPDATAAVFIQRLFTAYLPPVWGWFSLVWMRRRGYV